VPGIEDAQVAILITPAHIVARIGDNPANRARLFNPGFPCLTVVVGVLIERC
jgi:hypothetical protein